MSIRNVLVVSAFLAVGLIGDAAWARMAESVNQSESHLPALPPPADSATARQKWFLDYVKEIADYPHFDDANDMAQLLQTQFTTRHVEDHKEKRCDNPDSRSFSQRVSTIDVYTPGKDFWFRALPGGVQHMHLPGGGIFNVPARDVGDPEAGFAIDKTTTCGGRHRIHPEMSVHIRFYNVPGFVCITDDQLQTFLPQAKGVRVIDGPKTYGYKTRILEESGVLVRFSLQETALEGWKLIKMNDTARKPSEWIRNFQIVLTQRMLTQVIPNAAGGFQR